MEPRTRITIDMSGMDAIMAMSEGNPGAVSVLVQLIRDGAAIDPDAALGGLGAILSLDTARVYKDRIWMLYKDVCGQNLAKMMGMIRAQQLGILYDEKIDLDQLIDGVVKMDITPILRKVKERLPAFGLPDLAPVPA